MNVNPALPGTMLPMAGAAGTTNPPPANSTQEPQNMFLQLLTAQLQHQTPLDPIDPAQFTSELAQFNMLDQLAQINQTLRNALWVSPPAAGKSNPSNPSTQGAQ